MIGEFVPCFLPKSTWSESAGHACVQSHAHEKTPFVPHVFFLCCLSSSTALHEANDQLELTNPETPRAIVTTITSVTGIAAVRFRSKGNTAKNHIAESWYCMAEPTQKAILPYFARVPEKEWDLRMTWVVFAHAHMAD